MEYYSSAEVVTQGGDTTKGPFVKLTALKTSTITMKSKVIGGIGTSTAPVTVGLGASSSIEGVNIVSATLLTGGPIICYRA